MILYIVYCIWYEVVSNAEKSFIQILVRDIDVFRTNGDKEYALKFALDNGFNTATNSPLESFQDKTKCNYFKMDSGKNNKW